MSKIINGKEIAEEIKNEIKNEITKLKTKPCLAVIVVGKNPSSQIYVKNKKLACEKVGIKSISHELKENTSEKELLKLINNLNSDKNIHGILVQLPLPIHIDENKIINAINPEKDVDGFHPLNIGKMMLGTKTLLPCTPAGIIEILKRSNVEIEGKHAVVLGRSNIVGKPLAQLLLNENATISICHSKTKSLAEISKQADILIVAIGKANFITKEMIKKDAIIIDVGINRMENNKICGDVDFEDVKNKASLITPVPGGVGPITIAMLLQNTLKAYNL
jgi:methylenetetrahydrofolate dehydrogenase (NADP+)/methenyltetrahydrofolate cyclohydrolase